MRSQRQTPAVAAVDVGSSKVAVAVAVPEAGGLRVLGVGQAACVGIRRGAVIDVEAASACIAAAAERARRVSGRSLPPVMLGSAGGEIRSCNREVELRIDPPAELGAGHVAELMAELRRTELPPGYRLVHAIAQEYTVDGYEGCTQPVGMAAGRLGVSAHLVACHGTLLANLLRAVDRAGLQAEDFAVAALASAESVLTDAERTAGVLLCDIGASSTQVAVVLGGEPVGCAVVPLGGEHITADIAAGLGIARDTAEGIKCRLATADARGASETPLQGLPEFATVSPAAPEATARAADAGARVATATGQDPVLARATERGLAEVVQARAEEVLERVAALVRDSGLLGHLSAGVVLTGGGSRLRGLPAVAMRTLGMPVRNGGPLGTAGALAAPECAACVGLLQFAALRRTGGRRLTPVATGLRRPWAWPTWRGGRR